MFGPGLGSHDILYWALAGRSARPGAARAELHESQMRNSQNRVVLSRAFFHFTPRKAECGPSQNAEGFAQPQNFLSLLALRMIAFWEPALGSPRCGSLLASQFFTLSCLITAAFSVARYRKRHDHVPTDMHAERTGYAGSSRQQRFQVSRRDCLMKATLFAWEPSGPLVFVTRCATVC